MPWTMRMTLISFGLVLIPYIYVFWRLAAALNLIIPDHGRTIRISVVLLFFLLNLLPVLILILYPFTDLQSFFLLKDRIGWMDILVIFPFWIGLIAVVEVFFYFLSLEIIQGLIRWLAAGHLERWRTILSYGRLLLFVIILLNAGIRVYFDTYRIQNRQETIRIPDLPAGLSGLKLVLVADLQIDRFTQETKIERFQSRVSQADPDLLLFAGDLVTRGTSFIPQGLDVLCNTRARIERIACIGDHDVWSDPEQVARGLSSCGWTFLNDQHRVIRKGDATILITGITHVYSRRISEAELDRVLDSAPEADLKILLVHQPAAHVLDAAEKAGYDLFFAGHTHGGQIVFRPLGFTLTPTQFENKIFSGYRLRNGMHVFVTNGIGLTMVPLRYRAQAEIMTVKLEPLTEVQDQF